MISTDTNNNGPLTVTEGSNLVLTCEVTGNGPLNYMWNKAQKQLPDTATLTDGGKTLNISTIAVDDGGEYYCVVDNGGNSVSSMSVQVTVKSKSLYINSVMFNYLYAGRPSITDTASNKKVDIISGTEHIRLTCEVTGDDIRGAYWERMNGGPIPNQNNMSSLSNNKRTLTITIKRARPDHTGKYRCVAYSQWGVARSKHVQVTITSKSNNVLM